jgi:NADH-quinone oxidoreductase subunit N
MNTLMALLPDIILGLGAITLMLIVGFIGDKAVRLLGWLAAALLLAASLSLYYTPTHMPTGLFGMVVSDGFALYARVLIYLAAAVSAAFAPRWFAAHDEARGEYPVLVLFAALGMGIMVAAHNFLSFYVGLELNALASYVLAALSRRDGRSPEAGLKYFVLGALASGILLYGISLLYGFTGSIDYSEVSAVMAAGAHSLPLLFALVFILTGLAFKISAVPFHMWTPDVYEGAPTPVTAFFATAPKVAALAALTRIIWVPLVSVGGQWVQIISFLALASILLGAFGAIGQKNIKRLLAYSSINNVGFMLIGLAAASHAGVSAMLFYLAVYVITTLGSFLAVAQMRNARGEAVEEIATLSGLSQTRPVLAASLAIFMFSLAGIPPLFGFWPKLLVFQAALQSGQLPLVVIGIVASVIGAFYYIKIIKLMYFDAPCDIIAASPSRVEQAVMLGLALLLVVGYVFIPQLSSLAGVAAHSLS